MYIAIIGSSPGESIVILFDTGDVVTIDCSKTAGVNNTIKQLKEFGINPENVLYNVVSHFHDDHIKGMAELIEYCPNSKVVIPDVWTEDIFKKYVAMNSKNVAFGKISTIREIEKVFDFLGSNRDRVITVCEMTALYPLVGKFGESVESLSVLTPTHSRKHKFLDRLAEEIGKDEVSAFNFCEKNKNWTSISCLLSFGSKHIFLGGDIENTAPELDLDEIHKNHLNELERYDLVKLPHHGSSTSFCNDLRALIDNNHTVVAITPYPRGKKRLPNMETKEHLADAKRVHVLSGEKIGKQRKQRMRRRTFHNFDPIDLPLSFSSTWS